jgi:rhomboid protease GluP
MTDRRDWPWVSITIAIMCVVVFGLEIAGGANPITSQGSWLREYGVNAGLLTLGANEPWRLVTSMFLHYGALHLALNMFVLLTSGRVVEKLFGRVSFIVLYLLSGLGGSLVSATGPGASVGASGAIFGVFGAFGAYLLVHHDRLDPEQRSKQVKSLLGLLAINILVGLQFAFVDMRAHLGGLGAGFICGIALQYKTPIAGSTLKRGLLVGVLGVGLVFGATRVIGPSSNARLEFVETQNQVIPKVQAILQSLDSAPDGSKNEQIASELDQQIAIWRAAREKYERDGDGPDFEGLRKFMTLRERGWQKIADGLRKNDIEMIMSGVQDGKDADSVVEKVNQAD